MWGYLFIRIFIKRWFLVPCAPLVIMLSNSYLSACWRHKVSATLVAKYLLCINIMKRRKRLDDTAYVVFTHPFVIIIIIIFLNNVWISIYMIFCIPVGTLSLILRSLSKALHKLSAWGRCRPTEPVNWRTNLAFKEALWHNIVNWFSFQKRIRQKTANDLKAMRD